MTAITDAYDVILVSAAGNALARQNGLLTVANSTTYYAELGGASAGHVAMQWSWGSSLVASITYETTNYSLTEASIYAAAGSLWYPEAVTALTIAGGTAGTHMQHLVDFCARRIRAKIVVTTGGTAQLRGRSHRKEG